MANSYQESIDKVKADIISIEGSIVSIGDKINAVGAGTGFKNITTTVRELKEALASLQTQEGKLVKAKEKKIELTREEVLNQRELAKNVDIEIKANSKLIGAYGNLIAKRKQAKKVLQDLIVTEGKNSKATRQAQSDYDKLSKKVNQANKAVSNFSNTGLGKLAKGFRNLVGAFGVVAGVSIFASFTKDVFQTTKKLQSLDFALKAIAKTTIEFARVQKFLNKISNDYGADIVTTTERYTKFLAAAKQSNVSLKDTEDIFRTVTKASGVLGLKTDELTGIYLALEQMLSKGKVTTEELRRQLGERLPGAFGIMADAVGVNTVQLDKMLRAGEILSAEALPKFAKQLEKAYGIESVGKIDTIVAAQIRMKNAWVDFIRSFDSGGALTRILSGLFNGISKAINLFAELNTVSRTYIDIIKEEQIELNSLVGQITDVNIGNDKRNGLIKKLTTKYPFFLKLLGKEGTSNENLANTLREVNELYIKRIALQSQQENINKLLEKTGNRTLDNVKKKLDLEGNLNKINIENKLGLDLTNKSLEERFELVKNTLALTAKSEKQGSRVKLNEEQRILNKLNAEYVIYQGGLGNAVNLSKNLTDEQVLMKQIEEELGFTLAQLNDLFGVNTSEIIKNTGAADENADAKTDAMNALKGSVKSYQEIASKLKEEQANLATNTVQYKKYGEAIDEIDKKIKILQGTYDALDESEISSLADILDAQELAEASEEISKALNAGIDRGMNSLSDAIGVPVSDLFAEFNDQYEWDYQNFLKFSQKKIEQSEEETEKRRESLIEILETASEITAQIGELGSALFEGKVQQYEDDINRNKDYYAQLLDNENLSTEQRDALEAERDRKERALEKKKREAERKQAVFNKIAAVAEIGINTAVAVTKALAQTGVLGSFVIPGIIALGALQAATVLATPIPQYFKGKGDYDNYEGAAIWGERRRELKISSDGSMELSPKRIGNHLTHVKKDDIIHPNADKFLSNMANNEMYENIHKYALLSSLNNGGGNVADYLAAKSIENGLEKQTDRLVKAYKDSRPKINLHNHNNIDLEYLFRKQDTL